MFLKKHQMIQAKEDSHKAKPVSEPLYKGKAESKLHVETKAAAEKKREKFNPEKDTGSDAMTMGGRLPVMGNIRAVPSWRQGV